MARFVRQAPRLPKSVEEKLRSKGMVLKRSQEGKIYFSCSYRGRFSAYVVTRKGEQWLKELGYEEGDLIDRHLVQDLHDFGYIEVNESLTPASRRRSGSVTRNRRPVHVPEWLASVRKQDHGKP